MRIGLFTDVYLPSVSGVVVAVETLKKVLEKKGHKVFIITMNNNPKSHRYIRKNNCLMIPGLPLGLYDYSLRITYPLKAVKMVKDLDLDIIHSHTEFGMGTFAKSMAKKLEIPQIHTYHTMYQDSLDYITKGLFPKASANALKLYMKGFFHSTVKEIIVPTKKTKDFLQKSYGIKTNINIIPNGIDIERFYKEKCDSIEIEKIRKNLKLDKKDFVILWVGRLGYEKRIDFLIERQAELVKNNKNCKLVIIGGGPEEDNLRALVQELNLDNNVIFGGKIPYDKINNYYQVASIVATASFYETQGLTIVEALAASKPVIASADEVFKSVIINDNNGYIFNSKRDYCRRVQELINNNKKLELLSSKARESAEEYSLEIFVKKILNLYEGALKEETRD